MASEAAVGSSGTVPGEAAVSGDKHWPAADPGSDMRITGGAGALRRLARSAVLEAQRSATGRVLDLRGPLAGGFAYESASELVVVPAASLGAAPDGPFDTVCSFGALAAARSRQDLVARLRSLLAAGGRLLFVELDGDASRRRRRLDRLARRRWGVSMAADISGDLWAAGYEVTSVDRRPLRQGRAGLLRVVVGVARPDPHRAGGPQEARGAVRAAT